MSYRVMAFIDGFNLYHSLKNNPNYHKYKWLDLNGLVKQFLSRDENLIETHYFTAYAHWKKQAMARHRNYIRVLEYFGVHITLGRFMKKDRKSFAVCNHDCPESAGPQINGKKVCGKTFLTYEEKLTDVNIAVKILYTAVLKLCDSLYLVSGDNDLVPALQTAKELAPKIKITLLLPIGAKAQSMKETCKSNGYRYMRIKERHLKNAQFEDNITIGTDVFTRPQSWK